MPHDHRLGPGQPCEKCGFVYGEHTAACPNLKPPPEPLIDGRTPTQWSELGKIRAAVELLRTALLEAISQAELHNADYGQRTDPLTIARWGKVHHMTDGVVPEPPKEKPS